MNTTLSVRNHSQSSDSHTLLSFLTTVLKDDFLKTPKSEDEWRAIAKNFVEKWQFPHCLGALDGKHIYIQPTAHSRSTVGTQGRVSDAGLFATSDLRKALDKGLLNVPPPEELPRSDVFLLYMFVGDEAYPLRTDLMKPYPFRQLDHNQRVYNYRLSRARRVVENAFCILANRITLASACLHNFLCERRSEAYMPPALADWEDADHRVNEGAWRRDGLGAMQNSHERSHCAVPGWSISRPEPPSSPPDTLFRGAGQSERDAEEITRCYSVCLFGGQPPDTGAL
ncbi:unnamed protein product [Leuciscus chuanchicus]